MPSRLLAAPALLLALTACGGGNADADDADDTPDLPACTTLWQAGSTLPQGYDGCTDGPDSIVAAVWFECNAGGRYTTYDDALFAFEGGTIVETAGDVADLYSDCMGEPRVPR